MKLKNLENYRQKQSLKYRIFLIIFSISFFIAVITSFTLLVNINDINKTLLMVLISSIALMIILGLLALRAKKLFRAAVKEALITDNLALQFTDFNFIMDKYINKSIINEVGIFERSFSISGEDYLIGKYKNLEFEVSDIKLVKNSGDSSKVTFNGRWFIFTLDKDFNETIKIVNGNIKHINKKGLHLDRTNNASFDSLFHIYSSNKDFSKAFLTQVMIDNILKLQASLNGSLSFALINNKLHVAINDKTDFLKININKKITKDIVEELKDELRQITQLIDELDLTNIKI